ncbi:MAG: hypothetical protein JWQ18_1346 [Conexibacter sp.]|nr:hypothetical protein [Conexibacter sp.]
MSDAHDQTLLDLVAEIVGLLDVDEFRAGLIDALRRAIPADWISLNDLGPDPAAIVTIVVPEMTAEQHATYARHAFDNPLVQRYQRTLDGRAYRFSDVATREELHASGLHREFYAPIGLEHQIAFTLPHAPDRVLAIAISRRGHDFTDAERDLLDRARPFLIQAYRNAAEHSALRHRFAALRHGPSLPLADHAFAAALTARGITRREGEILGWVATGRSNREIADLLELSERTVQKHLQRCFAKLGARSRAQAIARARELAHAQ